MLLFFIPSSMTWPLLVAGRDIEPYIPHYFTEHDQQKIHALAQVIEQKIHAALALPLSYNGITRIVLPKSLYLQKATRARFTRVAHPTKGSILRVSAPWARHTIATDVYELESEKSGKWWWKTFHLDRIDRLAPLSFDEARSDLRWHVTPSVIDDYENEQLHDVGTAFMRNWNAHHRSYLAQADSPRDMHRYKNKN